MTTCDPHGWDERHRGKAPGDPEPYLIEMLPLLPRGGRVLDVAAGRGRNALALARARFTVVAADLSMVGLEILAAAARAQRLPIWPVLVNFDTFAFRAGSLDAIVNLNFLDRSLFAEFLRMLRPGGVLLADTFLIDQAQVGSPRDRRFLLEHYELRALLSQFEILRYREGLAVYPDGVQAWRAGAVARRRN